MNTKLAISGHNFNSLESFLNPSPFPGPPIKSDDLEFTKETFTKVILENISLNKQVTEQLKKILFLQKENINLYKEADQYKDKCLVLYEKLQDRSHLSVSFRKEAII